MHKCIYVWKEEKEREIVTSVLGTWTPIVECTWFVNTLNFGLRAFPAGPPSIPNSLNLEKVMHYIKRQIKLKKHDTFSGKVKQSQKAALCKVGWDYKG